MNELYIPSAVNWHCHSVLDCAPDNTVIYASRKDLFIISPTDVSEPCCISKIGEAHSGRITGLCINKQDWNNPNKYVASISEDQNVCLWDLNILSLKMYHTEHKQKKEEPVSVSLVGDRIITVTENGAILVWKLSTNEVTRITDVFHSKKIKIKFMSFCPHTNWLVAFCVNGGYIYIVDLKMKKILYKLHNDDKDVIGLSWCPAPFNIFVNNLESVNSISKNSEDKFTENKSDETIDESQTVEELNMLTETEVCNLCVPKNDELDYKICDEYDNSKNETVHKDVLNCDIKALRKKIDVSNSWANIKCSNLGNTEENISGNKKNVTDFPKDEDFTNTQYKDIFQNRRFISNKSDNDYLLASVDVEGNTCIWRTITGRKEMKLQISKKYKRRPSFNDQKHGWKVICWITPDLLIVSSSLHQLFCWHLFELNNLENRYIPKERILYSHSNVIFAISTPYKLYTKIEKSNVDDIFIWTSSKDLTLQCTGIGQPQRSYAFYQTFNCSILCVIVSPIDPTKIALGTANGIRIWDLSIPHKQIIRMLIYNNQDRINCLDWHPVKDNYLAYGTADGKIGIYNINNFKKSIQFYHFHGSAVYKIQWGPIPNKEGKYGLYSYSSKEVIYSDESDLSSEPKKVNIGSNNAQMFSWNTDFSILAVGTKDGPVKLLTNNFEMYEIIYNPTKAVQCLAWHPESTVLDSGRSPFCNYLAVATNETQIYIFNSRTIDETREKSDLVTILKGHQSSVKSVVWCPQIGGRLASLSENSVIFIWNITSKCIMSTYKDEHISALLWSPLDSDLIIIGSKNNFLKIFRISKSLPSAHDATEKKNYKKNSLKVSEEKKINKEENVKDELNTEIGKKTYILPVVKRMHNSKEAQSVDTFKKILKNIEGKVEENSADEDNNDNEDMEYNTINPLQMFGSKQDMINILKHEERNHASKNCWENVCHLSLWRGNLSETLENALKNEVIDPWIISLSPMVSYSLWQKLSLKYAEQLVEKGNVLEASSYFLACHEVYKAIDALCDNHKYREALSIAKCRLPSDDEYITKVYKNWATHSARNGNYELAVQCYLKIGQLSSAAVLLNKRIDKDKLEFALELAEKSNNHDLEIALKAKLEALNQQSQEHSNYEANSSTVHIEQSRCEALMKSQNKNFKKSIEENPQELES